MYATDFLAMQLELDKFGHILCGAKKSMIVLIIVFFQAKQFNCGGLN